MRLIKLILSAPLQSWGVDSRWDNRNTAPMPTKSAIIGLLGCCLGYPRGDARLKKMDQSIHLATRADRPGRIMTDYHTVQGTDGILLSADGGNRGDDCTIVSPRQYLQDARFTIFLWGDDATLDNCFHALLHPHWAPCLGRKSCVPALPLLPKWVEADSVDEALRQITEEEKNCCEEIMQAEIEVLPGESLRPDERMIERMDTLIRADRNEYTRRRIRVSSVRREGVTACI